VDCSRPTRARPASLQPCAERPVVAARPRRRSRCAGRQSPPSGGLSACRPYTPNTRTGRSTAAAARRAYERERPLRQARLTQGLMNGSRRVRERVCERATDGAARPPSRNAEFRFRERGVCHPPRFCDHFALLRPVAVRDLRAGGDPGASGEEGERTPLEGDEGVGRAGVVQHGRGGVHRQCHPPQRRVTAGLYVAEGRRLRDRPPQPLESAAGIV
jgi:hypothetical protein